MTLLRPDGALDVRFDLFHSSQWNEIPNEDTRNSLAADGGLSIKRGRPDESGSVQPTSCNLSLNNRNGKYSLRNPFSPLAGLINRNTPLRVRMPGLPQWTQATVRATSSVVGSFVTSAAVTKPTGTQAGDILIAYQFTERFIANTTTPTGGGWEQLLIENHVNVAGNAGTSGVRVWWKVATATEPDSYTFTHDASGNENFIAMVAAIRDADPDVIPVFAATWFGGEDSAVSDVVTPSTMPPGTGSVELRFVAGQPASFAVGSTWTPPEGFTENEDVNDGGNGFITAALASRVHDDRPPEPTGFHTFTVDNSIGGIRGFSGFPAVTINIASVENPQMRAAVEVASWPTRWEWSGSDVWAPIEAAGITRRLSRQPALQGTIGRSISRLRTLGETTGAANPIAYWPMNDGRDAQQIAGQGDGAPFSISPGIQPGTVDGPPGDGSTPEMKVESDFSGSRISGSLPTLMQPLEDAHWEFSCWVRIEQSGFTGTVNIYDLFAAGGDLGRWRLSADATAETVSVEGFDAEDNASTGIIATVSRNIFDGVWHLIWLKARQRTNINVGLNLVVDNDVANQGQDFGPVPPNDVLGLPASIRFLTTTAADINSMSVSHAVLWDGRSSSGIGTEVFDAGQGFRGELPTSRVRRLCQEETVPCRVIGTSSHATFMGPQQTGSLLDLLDECEDADGGVLFEPRDFGLNFRSLSTLLGQQPVLELTYNAEGEVVTPLEPVDDDQFLRNDITASREGGSSARAVLESGPLSIQLPPSGAGVYDESFSVNVQSDEQLPSYANWRLHIGTIDETRFPVITVDLLGLLEFSKTELLENTAALDVSERFTIDNLPPWITGKLIDQVAFGFDETLAEFAWEITTNNVPASLFTPIGVFAEENETPPPDSPSRYDSLLSRSFTAFNAGVDAQLKTETLLGQLWTSNDGGVLLRRLPGESAETPDDPVLDITGDIDIRCDATLRNWGSGPDNQTLVAKYEPGTDQRSYWLLITAAGELRLQWTTDGTAGTILNRTADADIPAAPNHRLALRATLDVDAGGDHVVTFYSAPTIDGPWTRLGTPQQASGTTSIFSGTAALRVGAFGPTGDGAPTAGIIHAAEVRDGIDTSAGLLLDGSGFASTPDAASLDITGDIDLRADVSLADWTPGTNQGLIGKFVTTGDERSYLLRITTGGNIQMVWTVDGTMGTQISATSTIAVPATNTERVAVRATLDVDNGAAGRTITFYTAPTIAGPWVQLGAAVTTAGVTSIFSSNSALIAGAWGTGASEPMTGTLHAIEVRSGIDGTVVANPDFVAESPGTTSFEDGVGLTWTLNGTAQIVDASEGIVVANPDFTKRSAGVFPEVTSTQTSVGPSLTTSHLVQIPTGVVENDLLIAAVGLAREDNFPDFPTVPSGWSFIAGGGVALSSDPFTRLFVMARVADGTEGGTSVDVVTGDSNRFAAIAMRITNALPDIDLGISGGSINAAAVNTEFINPPEAIADWGLDRNLFIAIAEWADDNVQAIVFPAGYSGPQVTADDFSSNDSVSTVTAFRQLLASRDNPSRFELEQEQVSSAVTIVVRPASSSTIEFTDESGREWSVPGSVSGDLPFDVNIANIQMRVREVAYERPELVDVQSVASGTTGSFTVPAPEGLQEGDLLVAFHATDVGTVDSGTITGGTPWILLSQLLNDDGTGRLHVRYKFAGASEPTDYTVTQDSGADGVVSIAAVRGARLARPHIAIDGYVGGATAIPTLASTPVHESFELRWASSESGATYTPPDGFAERVDIASGGFVGGSLGVRYAPALGTGRHDFTASASVGDRAGVTVNIIGTQTMLVDQQPINAQPGQTRLIPAGEVVSLWTPARYGL